MKEHLTPMIIMIHFVPFHTKTLQKKLFRHLTFRRSRNRKRIAFDLWMAAEAYGSSKKLENRAEIEEMEFNGRSFKLL
jgi:hypothetical protein